MSTKVGSVVKAVLKDGKSTAIVLELDSHSTRLTSGDRVFVELTNAFNGDKVEFFTPQVTVTEPVPEFVVPQPINNDLSEEEKITDPQPDVKEPEKSVDVPSEEGIDSPPPVAPVTE